MTAVELLSLACKVAVPGPLAGSLSPAATSGLWASLNTDLGLSLPPSIPAGGRAFEKIRLERQVTACHDRLSLSARRAGDADL